MFFLSFLSFLPLTRLFVSLVSTASVYCDSSFLFTCFCLFRLVSLLYLSPSLLPLSCLFPLVNLNSRRFLSCIRSRVGGQVASFILSGRVVFSLIAEGDKRPTDGLLHLPMRRSFLRYQEQETDWTWRGGEGGRAGYSDKTHRHAS